MDPVSGRSTATHYGAATQALESTAKWLVTAFAAVGALILGGLPLTGLGALGSSELPRLILAVASLVVAGVAVYYMIRETSGVFMTEWITLAELSDQAFDEQLRMPDAVVDQQEVRTEGSLARSTLQPTRVGRLRLQPPSALVSDAVRGDSIGSAKLRDLQDLLKKIDLAREELYGHVARTIAELHRQLRSTNETAAKVAGGEVQLTRHDQDKLFARVQELRNAARDVVECANYHRTRQHFNALQKRLRWGVLIVAVSGLVFAYATNPPPKSEPVKVQVVPTQPRTIAPADRTP
jgi:hypothetical protein